MSVQISNSHLKKVTVIVVAAMLATSLSLSGCGRDNSSGVQDAESLSASNTQANTISFGGYSWRVLDAGNDAVFVVSEEIIELRRFDDSSNDWSTSEIREYLNGEFLDNFSVEEQQRILETYDVVNGSEEIQDKVFLLSVDEVLRYFNSYGDMYAYYDAENNPDDLISQYLGNDVERYWWLRTPGANGIGVSLAGSDGPVYSDENNVTRNNGVRPAMIISRASTPENTSAGSPNNSTKPQIPSGAINWTEARQHVGETVTVYGTVAATNYASSINGQPTYIDIGAAYPDTSRVSVIIWGEDRGNFSFAPETTYQGQAVCVTGEIYLYNGVCNIKVQSPSRILIVP